MSAAHPAHIGLPVRPVAEQSSRADRPVCAPESVPPRIWWRMCHPRSWTLRSRLLATLLGLLTLVCAGIGVSAITALRRYLTTQLDEQVIDAGWRSAAMVALGPLPPHRDGSPRFSEGRVRISSTVLAKPVAQPAPSSPTARSWKPRSSPIPARSSR